MNCTARLIIFDSIRGEKITIRVRPQIAAQAKTDAAVMSQLTETVMKSIHGESSTQQLMPLTLIEDSEKYTLSVSPAVHHRASEDLLFATQLLQNYKLTIRQQASNALTTTPAIEGTSILEESNSVELQLLEDESNQLYTLRVSPSEYKQALDDDTFARCLLATHKYNVNKEMMSKPAVGAPPSQDEATGYPSDFDDMETASSSQAGPQFRCRWTEKQTQLLLCLYKQHSHKLDDGLMTNKKVWTTIVEGLKEKGHSFDCRQCTTRMDSLKRSYNRVKDHNAVSGNSRKTCDYYQPLDEIFHKKPWIKPLSFAGSNIPMQDMDESDAMHNKRRRASDSMDRAEYMRQNLENQRKRLASTENYRQEKLKLLKDLADTLKGNK